MRTKPPGSAHLPSNGGSARWISRTFRSSLVEAEDDAVDGQRGARVFVCMHSEPLSVDRHQVCQLYTKSQLGATTMPSEARESHKRRPRYTALRLGRRVYDAAWRGTCRFANRSASNWRLRDN